MAYLLSLPGRLFVSAAHLTGKAPTCRLLVAAWHTDFQERLSSGSSSSIAG